MKLVVALVIKSYLVTNVENESCLVLNKYHFFHDLALVSFKQGLCFS